MSFKSKFCSRFTSFTLFSAHVVQCKQEVPSRDWLLQEIVDADALYLRSPVKADKELLEKGTFSALSPRRKRP
jgi:hypothetical protein